MSFFIQTTKYVLETSVTPVLTVLESDDGERSVLVLSIIPLVFHVLAH